jgi:chemotaxis protein methyltransferase CheR
MVKASRPILSQEEFLLFNEIITDEFGIRFADHKRQLLESRLQPRLEALHLTRFLDYYLQLVCDRAAELPRLAELVTNNETFFCREARHFEALFGRGLDDLLPSAVTPGSLRLLCAGCSSGEEAYSLRMFANQSFVRLARTRLEIDAFDLDARRIEKARRAEYERSSLRALNAEQVARLLTPLPTERWRVRPLHRAGVRFGVGNLLHVETFWSGALYDCVFCRNVLIYFSEGASRRAVATFARVLRPGGLLFLGHSESIIGMYPEFQTVRLGDSIVYRRVPA